MKKKIVWLVVTSWLVLALLAAACGGEEEEAAPGIKVTEVKPAAEKPAAEKPAAAKPVVEREAAPAVEEAPAAGADTASFTFTDLKGNKVERVVEKPRYGGTLILPQTTSILAWDEAVQAPWTTMAQLSLTNEELVQGDWTRGPIGSNDFDWGSTGYWANPQLMIGGLAESWEFPDRETIIFHIRQGVRWHNKPPVNGREFDADDVVYNLRRIYFDIKTSTMWGMAGVSNPVDVYATDKWTVVVKNPPGQQGLTWEYLSDWTRMFPREVIEKYGDHNQWENVTGTGPFMVTDYVPMSSATYVRNPDYWMKDPLFPENQLPYIDGLKQLVIPDVSTRLAALRTAKLDWHSGVEWMDADAFLKNYPDLQYWGGLIRGFPGLGWRVDKPELPFDDIRVRRALLMGINQQEIVDTYLGGRGSILNFKVMPLSGLMNAYTPPEKLPLSDDGFDNRKLYGYYPEEARQLLAEAGYPDGFQFELIMSDTWLYMDHAQMAAAYWDKIGVDMKLDVKEYGTFMSIYMKKTHKDALFCGRWGDQPYCMFMVRKGNMYNWSMVDDPYLDDMYDKITDVYFDVPKRDELMSEANLHIIDKAYYYVPPVGYQYHFWWPWLKGYHGEMALGVASAYWQKYVWIDQELKKEMGY